MCSSASRSVKVTKRTNAEIKNSQGTRGSVLLIFQVASEEPVIKVCSMSPYTFR